MLSQLVSWDIDLWIPQYIQYKLNMYRALRATNAFISQQKMRINTMQVHDASLHCLTRSNKQYGNRMADSTFSVSSVSIFLPYHECSV